MIFKGLCVCICLCASAVFTRWLGGRRRGGVLTIHMARQVMYVCRLPAVQLQSVLKRRAWARKIQREKLMAGSGDARHKTLAYLCRYIPYRNPPPKTIKWRDLTLINVINLSTSGLVCLLSCLHCSNKLGAMSSRIDQTHLRSVQTH